MVKTILVDVDGRTWGHKPIPQNLQHASGTYAIDLGQALHLLGSLTMPNTLSTASLALFWAWLRYFLAPTSHSDLRITNDFADLDPHQKTILSDDFGVAIGTYWMIEHFGGFTDIVDGRRFLLQFHRLLGGSTNPKAKVGSAKTPDFVIRDNAGKWHVLECKGTQTGHHQKESLKVATQQKRAIRIVGSIRGEELASALYIANENENRRSHLRVIDPIDSPLIELTENHAEEMEVKARRITIARALSTVGLSDFAVEMCLPPDLDRRSGATRALLRPSEMKRLRLSEDERHSRATEQARRRELTPLRYEDERYEGREVTLEMPPTAVGIALPFRRVTVRQGVQTDLLQEVTTRPSFRDESVDDRVRHYGAGGHVGMESDYGHIAFRYGHVLFSEMIWH